MQIDLANLNNVKPLRPSVNGPEQQLEAAQKLQQAYRDFVGNTFFGQMLKSMRSTVGEPAYFSGGQAEKVFRSQLDQQLADEMTAASADRLADPMFRHQFPREAKIIDDAAAKQREELYGDLSKLRRW